MSYIVVSYILQAPEGLKIDGTISDIIGIATAIGVFVLFMVKSRIIKSEASVEKGVDIKA